MEHGIGVLLKTEDPKSLDNLSHEQRSREKHHINLVEAEVYDVVHTGLGDRVCVDTTSMLKANEGMIIGSTGWGGIFVCSETHYLPHMNLREFRVNAGGVHSYIWRPGDSATYLNEAEAGTEVLVVNTKGEARSVVVGRAKIERRPLILVKCRVRLDSLAKDIREVALADAILKRNVTPNGEKIADVSEEFVFLNAFLQNDWHVRIIGANKVVKHSSLLVPGDKIWRTLTCQGVISECEFPSTFWKSELMFGFLFKKECRSQHQAFWFVILIQFIGLSSVALAQTGDKNGFRQSSTVGWSIDGLERQLGNALESDVEANLWFYNDGLVGPLNWGLRIQENDAENSIDFQFRELFFDFDLDNSTIVTVGKKLIDLDKGVIFRTNNLLEMQNRVLGFEDPNFLREGLPLVSIEYLADWWSVGLYGSNDLSSQRGFANGLLQYLVNAEISVSLFDFGFTWRSIQNSEFGNDIVNGLGATFAVQVSDEIVIYGSGYREDEIRRQDKRLASQLVELVDGVPSLPRDFYDKYTLGATTFLPFVDGGTLTIERFWDSTGLNDREAEVYFEREPLTFTRRQNYATIFSEVPMGSTTLSANLIRNLDDNSQIVSVGFEQDLNSSLKVDAEVSLSEGNSLSEFGNVSPDLSVRTGMKLRF